MQRIWIPHHDLAKKISPLTIQPCKCNRDDRPTSLRTTMASNESKQARRLALLAVSVTCLLLLLPQSASAATAVEYCKKGRNYPVKVTGVEIVPDPVAPGQPATFKVIASTDKPIEKGKLVIDVKYWLIFPIPVHSETHDICEETTCPATGDFVIAHSQTLPSYTPPGSYTITMTVKGANNEELSCISFGFSIGFVASGFE